MNASAEAGHQLKMHKIQQAVKWTVYTLLIINFVFYVFEDWNRAIHTLHAGSTFLDWTSEFANSIDETGWFLLLFMFELETYILDDEDCIQRPVEQAIERDLRRTPVGYRLH